MISHEEIGGYLRSRSIGSAFSRSFALLSYVASCSIGASSAAASSVVLPVAVALDVLHRLVIIVLAIVVVSNSGEFPRHINFFTLKKSVDDIADLAISGAEVARIAVASLRLRLQPE